MCEWAVSLIVCHSVGVLQVLMKDIVTPVPPEEVRSVIKKCLENAALVNYTRVSEYAKIEGSTPLLVVLSVSAHVLHSWILKWPPDRSSQTVYADLAKGIIDQALVMHNYDLKFDSW